MATNLAKVPLFRAIAARGYATCVPVGGTVNYDVKNTTLPNKLVVVGAENDSPISRVSIIFRAGSRHESHETQGAAHVIRVAAGLSTCNASQFAIIRNIQEVGANLTVTSDRELIAYTLEGTRDAVEQTLPFLTEVATKQIFKPWEISDNIYRLKLELATRPPQQRAIDLLHKAAYRSGLGNSLYIAKHQLDRINSESLQHYFKTHFVSGKAAVVGLGIDSTRLLNYAQELGIENKDKTTEVCKYKGGEIRSDKGGNYAFVAIAGEGGTVCNQKEALAFGALKYALGAGPQCSWGIGAGVLQKAVGESPNAAVKAINVNYADSGLFGAIIAAKYDAAGAATKAVLDVLKSGNVSDKDANRGKNLLKTAVLNELESGTKAVQAIGTHACITGTGYSAQQLAAAIDGLSASDISAAAKKVASSKISIASVGNLRTVPFLDEL